MHRFCIILISVLLLFISIQVAAQTCDSLSFTVTAEQTNDPGFEGMYKYTISGYWQVSGVEQGWGLSLLIFSLGEECPCLCDTPTEVVSFSDPAGTSTGMDGETDEPCEVQYLGFLQCSGHEDITMDAVIKFEMPDNQTCEPIHYGTGTWIFYSTMPPVEWQEYPGGTFIKYGEMLCTGYLSGQLPFCHDCLPVPTEQTSWGAIKVIYE